MKHKQDAHNLFITFLVVAVLIQSGLLFWMYTHEGNLPWANNETMEIAPTTEVAA